MRSGAGERDHCCCAQQTFILALSNDIKQAQIERWHHGTFCKTNWNWFRDDRVFKHAGYSVPILKTYSRKKNKQNLLSYKDLSKRLCIGNVCIYKTATHLCHSAGRYGYPALWYSVSHIFFPAFWDKCGKFGSDETLNITTSSKDMWSRSQKQKTCLVQLHLSGRWLSGSPIIRAGLPLRVNLSTVLQN